MSNSDPEAVQDSSDEVGQVTLHLASNVKLLLWLIVMKH